MHVADLNQVISDVVTSPDPDPNQLPGNFPILDAADRKIVSFYSRYNLWIFDYAETLAMGARLHTLDTDTRHSITGNAGFAVLTLLNSYFDTLGRLCGNDTDDIYVSLKGGKSWKLWDKTPTHKKRPSVEQCIWYGINEVFSAHLEQQGIDPVTDTLWHQVCDHLYQQTRNGIAHIGFPGGTIIFVPQPEHTQAEYHQPLLWGDYDGQFTIAINWIAWHKYLRNHFETYIFRLRNAYFVNHRHPDWQLRKRFLKRIDRLR